MTWKQRLPPLCIALLAVGFIWQARGFKPASGSIPLIIGWTVLMLAAIELASQSAGRVGTALNRLFAGKASHAPTLPAVQPGLQLAAVLGLCALLAGVVLIGLVPASAIFVLVAFRFGANRPWWQAVLAGAVIAVMLWLAFGALLGLELPGGLIFNRETA